jgi:hypothetical protein
VVGVAAAALSVAGLAPVVVLLVSGIALAVARGTRQGGKGAVAALLPISPAVAAGGAGSPVALTSLFLVFLKIGALAFGSGDVLPARTIDNAGGVRVAAPLEPPASG